MSLRYIISLLFSHKNVKNGTRKVLLKLEREKKKEIKCILPNSIRHPSIIKNSVYCCIYQGKCDTNPGLA